MLPKLVAVEESIVIRELMHPKHRLGGTVLPLRIGSKNKVGIPRDLQSARQHYRLTKLFAEITLAVPEGIDSNFLQLSGGVTRGVYGITGKHGNEDGNGHQARVVDFPNYVVADHVRAMDAFASRWGHEHDDPHFPLGGIEGGRKTPCVWDLAGLETRRHAKNRKHDN